MRFLFDENFPGNTIGPLQRLTKSRHVFLKPGRDYPTGISDVELFDTAASLGAEAVITADLLQIQGLDRKHERVQVSGIALDRGSSASPGPGPAHRSSSAGAASCGTRTNGSSDQ